MAELKFDELVEQFQGGSGDKWWAVVGAGVLIVKLLLKTPDRYGKQVVTLYIRLPLLACPMETEGDEQNMANMTVLDLVKTLESVGIRLTKRGWE